MVRKGEQERTRRGASAEPLPVAVIEDRAILITCNQSLAEGRSPYDAVRYAWNVDVRRAEAAEVILAVEHGVIIEAFVATRWMEATRENFPALPSDMPGRWGFEGEPAPPSVRARYVLRRVPDELRKRGAANPVRYVNPVGGD